MANALAYIAGGLLSGAGEAAQLHGKNMREERLAELKNAREDARFNTSETNKNMNSRLDRESRAGLLDAELKSKADITRAGLQSQKDLLDMKLQAAKSEGAEDRANKLELQMADITGKMERLDKEIGSKESIAQAGNVSAENIAAGRTSSAERITQANIESAEKIAGIKITSAEEIAKTNNAADLARLVEKSRSDFALLDKKIAAERAAGKEDNVAKLERLQTELKAREAETQKKIDAQKDIATDSNKTTLEATGMKIDADKKLVDTVSAQPDGSTRITFKDGTTKDVRPYDKGAGNMTMAEARQRAEAEVSAQAGLFSSDDSDFASTGGNRERAITERTLELFNGTAAPARPSGGAQAATTEKAPPASALKEGRKTTFKNGETWTLKNGQPVKVQ